MTDLPATLTPALLSVPADMLWVWKAEQLRRRWRPWRPPLLAWLHLPVAQPGTWPRLALTLFRTKRTRAWTVWLRWPAWKPCMAALKVHFADGYAHAAAAMAAPAVSPQERTAQEMAVTAEVACVLTVSERSAAALLAESATLTTGLPLTLSALRAGSISWQHARVMCDETSGLDPAGGGCLGGSFPGPRSSLCCAWLPGGRAGAGQVPGQSAQMA